MFDASCTFREINAVDSENKKNLQSDTRRVYQVNKHLSKEGHVFRKFGTGNKESLSKAGKAIALELRNGVDGDSDLLENGLDGGLVGHETRRRLVEWWEKEYCASRMKLCVVGTGKTPSILLSRFLVNEWDDQNPWMN